MSIKNTQKYIRKSIHSIEEVYKAIKDKMDYPRYKGKARVVFDGDEIKANSRRYQVFFHNGMKCTNCGIEGQYFAKERCSDTERFHLNLYGIDKDGQERLMTKNLIVPISRGGDNNLASYQCLCVRCNRKKNNRIVKEQES